MPMQMQMPMMMPLPTPPKRSRAMLIGLVLLILLLGGGAAAFMVFRKGAVTNQGSTAPTSTQDCNGVLMYMGKNYDGQSYCAKPGVALSDLPFVPQSANVPAGVYVQYTMGATTTAGGTFTGGGTTNSGWGNLNITLDKVTGISVVNLKV